MVFTATILILTSIVLLTVNFHSRRAHLNCWSALASEAGLEGKFDSSKIILICEISAFVFFILLQFAFKGWLIIKIPLALSLAVLGPIFMLMRARRIKNEKIVHAVPLFADLLTLSCEAGLDVLAALINILNHTEKSPFRDCIESIVMEIKMGKSRQDALRNAYRSTEIWDLKTIYLTILQSETLGTPLGKSLRCQVDMLRKARMNRAEKFAQKAPIKILIPLILFIFLPAFIIIISPFLINMINGTLF